MFGLESSFPQVSCTSICMWGEACVNVEMNEWYHFLDFAYIQFSWPCLYAFLQWLKHKVVPLCHAKKLFLPFKRLSTWHRGGRLRLLHLLRLPRHHGTCGLGGLAPPEALAVVALFDYLVSQTGVNALCLARDGLHQCISNMVAFRVGPSVQKFSASCISSLRATIANFWQHCGFTPTKPALPS